MGSRPGRSRRRGARAAAAGARGDARPAAAPSKEERTAVDLLRMRPMRMADLAKLGRLNERTVQLLKVYLLLVTKQVEMLSPAEAAAMSPSTQSMPAAGSDSRIKRNFTPTPQPRPSAAVPKKTPFPGVTPQKPTPLPRVPVQKATPFPEVPVSRRRSHRARAGRRAPFRPLPRGLRRAPRVSTRRRTSRRRASPASTRSGGPRSSSDRRRSTAPTTS